MGTGGMADGIVNSLDLSRSGRNLTVTLGRSIGADLAETVQLPEDENRFVDSLGVLVTGQTLTVTLGRTAPLPDLVDTATLPTGGMGGAAPKSFPCTNTTSRHGRWWRFTPPAGSAQTVAPRAFPAEANWDRNPRLHDS